VVPSITMLILRLFPQGVRTRKTITLEIDSGDIKVYLHEENGITLAETVPFKVYYICSKSENLVLIDAQQNIKSITIPDKNMVAVDWCHGPFQTNDVSRFHTNDGEVRKICGLPR
jgi:hypothetical protein